MSEFYKYINKQTDVDLCLIRLVKVSICIVNTIFQSYIILQTVFACCMLIVLK